MTLSSFKHRTLLCLIALAALFGASWFYLYPLNQQSEIAGPVNISALPQQIWLEAAEHHQALNFDFLLENQGTTPVGIDSIELKAYDSNNKLVLRRSIDSNGFAPSIETLPGRVLAPGSRSLVFNPFHSFRPDVELHRLQFVFSLSIVNAAPETTASITIEPRLYQSKTRLLLPLKGKMMVHDGHDYYAHHRRLNTEHPAATELGLTQNFMRFSLDLNSTDHNFALFRGTGERNEDWYAWNAPVYAAGDGVVAQAVGNVPDNIRGGSSFFRPEQVKTDAMHFYGNYILIDHGNGEFSLLGHLQRGSLLVKPGDKVTAGQMLASMGNSGSSNNPHPHYELRSGAGLHVEGLPANFNHYQRHLGSTVLPVASGPIDTGDLLENN